MSEVVPSQKVTCSWILNRAALRTSSRCQPRARTSLCAPQCGLGTDPRPHYGTR
jgi:hypothetical protein